MQLSAHSPAKINLFLNITGKRPNGYHDLETVFLPVEGLYDTITLTKAKAGISISSNSGLMPLDSNNLCWKAAELFSQESGITPEWSMDIQKHIPIAAGLGGGSSDAATVLLLLNRMYGNPLSDDVLHKLAYSLGADVPFFLNPELSSATGIGETLSPVEGPESCPVILINPLFPVSAAWTYTHTPSERWNGSLYSFNDFLTHLKSCSLEKISQYTYNILEAAVLDKFPLVQMIIDCLKENGALCAHVSGSGPTVYALCPEERQPVVKEIIAKTFGTKIWTYYSIDSDLNEQ